MIRLTPDLGNMFYVLLRYLQAGDIRGDNIFDWVRQRVEMEDRADPVFREVLEGIFPNPVQNPPGDLANLIGAALASDDDHADGELINDLVTVLKNPQARMILNGRILERLRRSILVGDEQMEVRRTLFRREMSCTSCGHQFEPGEIATVMAESVESQAQQTLVCTRCSPPITVACSTPKCHGKLRLHDKMIQAFHGKLTTKCEMCKEAEKSGITPNLTPSDVPRDFEGMLRRGDENDSWVMETDRPLDGPILETRRVRPPDSPWRPTPRSGARVVVGRTDTNRFGQIGQPAGRPMTENQRMREEQILIDQERERLRARASERIRFTPDGNIE